MTDTLQNKAQKLATKIVADAVQRGKPTITFSVMNDRKPVPFFVHWQRKNVTGVTFKKRETVAAETWIVTAMLAGYGVCDHWTGQRVGGGGVYGLAGAIAICDVPTSDTVH